jgi:hypothetical protein
MVQCKIIYFTSGTQRSHQIIVTEINYVVTKIEVST